MPFDIDQRQQLCDALVCLMHENTIDKITVQAIVDVCGVTRTTFYRYFKDKYDLLTYAFYNEVDTLAQNVHVNSRSFWEFLVDVCRMMREKEVFFRRAFLYEGQNSFFESVCDFSRDAVTAYLQETQGGMKLIEQSDYHYFVLSFAASATAVFRQWAMTGMKESPEEIASIISDICPVAFKEFIN